jgi:hypothetical protein
MADKFAENPALVRQNLVITPAFARDILLVELSLYIGRAQGNGSTRVGG